MIGVIISIPLYPFHIMHNSLIFFLKYIDYLPISHHDYSRWGKRLISSRLVPSMHCAEQENTFSWLYF